MRTINDSHLTLPDTPKILLNERLQRVRDLFLSYHRTREENVTPILKKGFYPGSGDMYGKGLYTTYDEESQFRSGMRQYGNVVIRFQINPKGVLVLDYNVAKELFGSKYSLNDQLIRNLRLYSDPYDIPDYLYEASEYLEASFSEPTKSAHVAFNTIVSGNSILDVDRGGKGLSYGYSRGKGLISSNGLPKYNQLRGILFSGNHDGNVLASYSISCAIPDKYILSPDPDGNIPSEEDWLELDQDLASASIVRATVAEQLYDFFGGQVLQLNVIPENVEYNTEKFRKDFQWISRSKFSAKTITLDFTNRRDPQIDFDEARWIRGEFNGRNFSGTFEGGKFNGEIFGGIFSYGTFLKGTFAGKWQDGLWKSGTWKGDYWNKGEIFEKGQFVPSTVDPITFFQNR